MCATQEAALHAERAEVALASEADAAADMLRAQLHEVSTRAEAAKQVCVPSWSNATCFWSDKLLPGPYGSRSILIDALTAPPTHSLTYSQDDESLNCCTIVGVAQSHWSR